MNNKTIVKTKILDIKNFDILYLTALIIHKNLVILL